jgi:N-acetylglutamate synthase-like GNAT family acetyltransferase
MVVIRRKGMLKRIGVEDRIRVSRFFESHWRAPIVVSRGRVHTADDLEGFLYEEDGAISGLITYRVDGKELEVVTVDALKQHRGLGTRLLEAVDREARERKSARIWLITTNDNLEALRFFQRRGFSLVAVHRDALTVARKLKPSIPTVGNFNLPLKDEIELEKLILPPLTRGSGPDTAL